jgi:octanoyl-[GcvH]:protein N-octanoyltransferase
MVFDMSKERCWRVVSIPEVDAAEIGLARLQTLSDELTSQSDTPVLAVWRCRAAVLATRSETRLPHFDRAAAEMQAAGRPIVVRKSGGAACPVGPGTVQAAIIEPRVAGTTMNAEYEALTRLIRLTLHGFQVACRSGPVAGAYCPGSYDLGVGGRKIAGMSQHWFRNRRGVPCAVTTASINVEEAPDALAEAVNRFYRSAGSPTRCRSSALTSLRQCGGTAVLAVRDLPLAVMDEFASVATGAPGEVPALFADSAETNGDASRPPPGLLVSSGAENS